MKTKHTFSEQQYSEIMSRMYVVTHTKTQVELAKILGIRQASVSEAKKRKAVPAEWLLTLLRLQGINPEWVVSGEGVQMVKLGCGRED